jgi:hypothetical protein
VNTTDTNSRALPPAGAGAHGLPRDLLDVCRRLKLFVQVVGEEALSTSSTTAFASRWTPDSKVLARLEEPALQIALRDVLLTGKDLLVQIGDVEVAFARIPKSDGAPNGAIVLARRLSNGWLDLATVASWFAAAFAPVTLAAPCPDSEIRRLASLLAILDGAVASRSESEIVRAFVEALSVWTDLELWGYLGDVSGEFVLHVWLPGSANEEMPAMLAREESPDAGRYVVLPGTAPVFFFRPFVSVGSDWLIATRSELDEAERARLLVFCHVLGLALMSLAAVDLSRLTWALFDGLAPDRSDAAFDASVENGVEALRAIVGAPTAFVFGENDDEPTLTVGDWPQPFFPDESLVVQVPLASPWHAAFALGRPHSRPLTKRDKDLANSAAKAFGVYLTAVVSRSSFAHRPRKRAGFETMSGSRLDAFPDKPCEPAMIVVGRADGAWQLADDLNDSARWLADIQRLVRPDDVVARLPSGDLGILLAETDSIGARVVAKRLKEIIDADGSPVVVSFSTPDQENPSLTNAGAVMDAGL